MSSEKERVLVVFALAGGNDFLNTLIPYTNPLYYDYRGTLKIPAEEVLPIDDELAFNPNTKETKELYDDGKVAMVQGVGYPNPNRSHFRSMDIWHTCEPDKIGDEGWLGRTVRDLDPKGENVLTGLNVGRGLPRVFVAKGVPVASVGNLESYGLLTGMSEETERNKALEIFSRMYAPAIGSGPVTDYIWETGRAAMTGADILKEAPQKYSSTIEYENNAIGYSLKSVAQVHLAGLGTRIFYTGAPFNSFDSHGNQARDHGPLLAKVSRAMNDFYQDMKEHNAGKEVLLFAFSEFGRRVMDNGGGTDHGTGGGCWLIGDMVKGGLYGQYPSLNKEDLEDDGDLCHNVDFRSVYATILEQWLGLDSKPIVGGTFEQLDLIEN